MTTKKNIIKEIARDAKTDSITSAFTVVGNRQ